MSSGAWLTVLSALALLGGALVPSRLRGGTLPALLQGFVLASVSGLVLFAVLPEAVHHAGPLAFVVAFLGLALPYLAPRSAPGSTTTASGLVLGAGFVGLLLHTALDGVGLATADRATGSGAALPLAIVAHRFPVGLALWLIVAPRFGRRAAWAVLALVAATTVFGFLLGDVLLPERDTPALSLFQAFVAGTLLHVLLHTPTIEPDDAGPVAETLGAAVGVAALLLLPEAHAHGASEGGAYRGRLLSLALLTAPPLLLGHAVSLALSRRGRVPLPRGSMLGVEALLVSLPLLGGGLAVTRAVAGAPLALLTARSSDGGRHRDRMEAPAARADTTLWSATNALVKETSPWVLLGLALAAALEPDALSAWRARLPLGGEVWVAALLALPLRISALASIPLAAASVHAGASVGAALAFMLAGPAHSLDDLRRWSRDRGLGAAAARGAGLVVYAGLAGTLANTVLAGPRGAAPPLPALDRAAGAPGPWLAAAMLGALYLRAVFELGPRRFLDPLTAQVQSSQTPRT